MIGMLEIGQGKVNITARVVSIEEPREFQRVTKEGRVTGRVTTALVEDSSGEVHLSLWNQQIDEVKVGDIVKIRNGYVKTWHELPQLTTGKFGKIEVVKSRGVN